MILSTLFEKLSKAEKEKLPDSDFALPDERKFPIHTEKQATIALTFAAWKNNEPVRKQVVQAIVKRYPNLKTKGAAKEFRFDNDNNVR